MLERKNILIGLLVGLAGMAVMFQTLGYHGTWRWWNVPAPDEPFMDVAVIAAGADSVRQGLDPLVSNPGDVAQRRLNYPRIWQAVGGLGFYHGDVAWFGGLSVLLFLAGVVIVRPPPGWNGAGWLLAAVFSPAVLLGMERGNTDLLMFFLLAVALALVRRHTVWSLVLVLVAFALKLYPLLGLAVLLGRERKVAVAGAIGAGGLALLYLLYNLGDLVLIRNGTPQGDWISYGVDVAGVWAAKTSESLRVVVRGLGWAGAFVVLGYSLSQRRGVRATEESPWLDGFRVGASCYVGTFLLGTNFNYRLIFLLFAIPQLLEWARNPASGRTTVARLGLGGIYVSLWSMVIEGLLSATPVGPGPSYLIAEAGHWTAFGVLTWLFFRTLPDWLPVSPGGVRPAATEEASSR